MHGLQRNGFPGGKPARVGNSQDLPSQVSGLRGKGKNYGRQLRGQFNADEGAMDAATSLAHRALLAMPGCRSS